MNRTMYFLLALLLASILPATAGADQDQEARCSASPQVMMQNIIKLNRQGDISKAEMMRQLSLYKHSLPKNEWERLINQSVGGGIQYASSPAQSEFAAAEAETETGAISGQVINGTTGGIGIYGLANVQVTVYDAEYNWIGSSTTNFDGNYTVGNIPSGTDYKVKFFSQTGYGEQWYNNKDHFCRADSVAVTAPDTTGNIDAELKYPGMSTISGTVTDENGTRLGGVEVRLYNENDSWDYLNSITTDSFGDYSFFGVGTGRYKLKFDGGETSHGSEWYNDKTDFWNADVVEVTDPAEVTGINAMLATGGSISGKVTDVNGNPITWYDIELYDSNGSYLSRHSINSTDGTYTIAGLPSSQYKLRFSAWNYAPEWYSNKSDFDHADAEPISVVSPSATSGINVVLEAGGGVSGKVTDESNVGIPDIMVWVDTDIDGRTWGYGSPTDADGNYTITGNCATGDWKVEFDAGWNKTGYASEWYDNKASDETADPIHITAPETITINAQLAQGTASGGSISGRVTDGTNPLFGVNVSVYDSNNSWIQSASTNCNGEYTVTGLAEGTYKVSFSDYTYGLPSEWYNDKANFDSADPITVTNSAPATGINAVLGSGQHSGQQMSLAPVMMLLLNK